MWGRVTQALMLRPGEGRKTAYLLAINIVLGIGLAIGRATSETLFFKRVGVDALPLFYVWLSFSLFFACTIYAAIVDRWSAEKLFGWLFYSFVLTLVLLGFAIRGSHSNVLVYAYFLFYDVVSEILIIHIAHYLAQNLDLGQGKRLMSLILGGNQVGIVIGGAMVAFICGSIPIEGFLYLWASIFLIAILMLGRWHARMGVSPYYSSKPRRRSSMRRSLDEIGEGVKALWSIPLARVSAVALFFMVVAFYFLNYVVNKVYVANFKSETELMTFFGSLNSILSLIAIATQFVLSNRIIKVLGIKRINYIYPASNLLSFALLLANFSMIPALFGSFSRGVLLPGFRNPARNIIMNIMSPRLQGRIRASMLGFVMPVALIVSGAVLYVVLDYFTVDLVLWLGVVSSCAYLIANFAMNRAYQSELLQGLRSKTFIKNSVRDVLTIEPAAKQQLAKEIEHCSADVAAHYAELLAGVDPELATRAIENRLTRSDVKSRDLLIAAAARFQLKLDEAILASALRDADDHLKATVLISYRGIENSIIASLAVESASSPNPRLAVAQMRYLLAGSFDQPTMLNHWISLFYGDDINRRIALVDAIADLAKLQRPGLVVDEYLKLFVLLLQRDDRHGVEAVLRALSDWPYPINPRLEEQLVSLAGSIDIDDRRGAYRLLHLLDSKVAVALAWKGLLDANHKIRKVALAFLGEREILTVSTVLARLNGPATLHPRLVECLLEYLEEQGLNREIYENISYRLVGWADKYLAAYVWHRQKRGDRSVDEVTGYALRERAQQFVDLSLAALQGSENREDIAIVRKIIHAGDQLSFSHAEEAIGHLSNKLLADTILSTLERISELDMPRKKAAVESGDAHAWLTSSEDSWIRELVVAAG